MRDVLPVQARRRRLLQERILQTFESYGYEQVETPMLEDLSRLLDSEAGDNTKLIYKVLRRGLDWTADAPKTEHEATDLGLRYDLTVPLARFFATNQAALPFPFKAIQIAPAFRAERPQKGRYRQFTQCDIDVLGDPSAVADAELVCATIAALRACGLEGFSLRMNHRKLLDSLLQRSGFTDDNSAVLMILDKLDKIGAEGVTKELAELNASAATNLMDRVASLSAENSVASVANALGDGVDAQALEDMRTIEEAIHANEPGIGVSLDVSVVRGQGYYTGPVFEIMHAELGGTLAGGGRYDNMINKLSGIDVPATGMSIGFERLDSLLDSLLESAELNRDGKRLVLLHANESPATVISAANKLRDDSTNVRTERAANNRRAQLERLSNAGFTHFAVLGNDEVRELDGDTKQ